MKLIIFISLYKYFRTTDWDKIKEDIEKNVETPLAGLVGGLAGIAFDAAWKSYRHETERAAKDKLAITTVPTMDWFKMELKKYNLYQKEDGTGTYLTDYNAAQIFKLWVIDYPKIEKKDSWQYINMKGIYEDYVKLLELKKNPPKYYLSPLEAAAYAALIIVMLQAGLSAGANIVTGKVMG